MINGDGNDNDGDDGINNDDSNKDDNDDRYKDDNDGDDGNYDIPGADTGIKERGAWRVGQKPQPLPPLIRHC